VVVIVVVVLVVEEQDCEWGEGKKNMRIIGQGAKVGTMRVTYLRRGAMKPESRKARKYFQSR
jgi:hypothetical protein